MTTDQDTIARLTAKNDARIPDHCGWAARGHWSRAYKALLEDHACLSADITSVQDYAAEAITRAVTAEAALETLRAQIGAVLVEAAGVADK